MEAPIRSLVRVAPLAATLSLTALLTGCPDPPAAPPAFEPCGSVNVRITGRMGLGSLGPRNVSTTATLEETSTTVDWKTAGSGTGTVLDDTKASGSTTLDTQSKQRSFSATGTSGNHTLDVTGTIDPDCSGSGSWTVNITDSGQLIGRGRWNIQ